MLLVPITISHSVRVNFLLELVYISVEWENVWNWKLPEMSDFDPHHFISNEWLYYNIFLLQNLPKFNIESRNDYYIPMLVYSPQSLPCWIAFSVMPLAQVSLSWWWIHPNKAHP